MMQKIRLHNTLILLSGVGLLISLPMSAQPINANLEQDEEVFVFMGRCPNGDMYRLKAYQKLVEGIQYSYYDYEGPAGEGTIQSKTAPKTLMARVCRALAEIQGDS